MKQRIIWCFCLALVTSGAYAQATINYSKSRVRQTLRTLCRSNNWPTSSITEEPLVTTLNINDTLYQPATFKYYFNKKNKCYQEQKITFCDSCYRKYTNEYLDKKRYEWVKLNDTVYVSKYSRYRRVELHPANRTIDFIKTFWTKEEYDRMIAGNR